MPIDSSSGRYARSQRKRGGCISKRPERRRGKTDQDWPDRAIVVVHGIGEQRRGSTLEALVRAFRRGGAGEPVPVVDPKPFGETLPKPALRVTRDQTTADLYEVYWAPHTARKTTARSVLWWLFRTTFIPGARLKHPSLKTWWDIGTALVAVVALSLLLLYALTSLGNLSAQVACRADPKVTCELPPEERKITGPEVTAEWHRQLGAVFGAVKDSLTLTNRPLAEISPSHVAEVLNLIPVRYWLLMMAVAFVLAQFFYRLIQVLGAFVRGRQQFAENHFTAQLWVLGGLIGAFVLLIQMLAPVVVAFVLVVVLVTTILRAGSRFLAESLGDVHVYAERDENSEHYQARERVLEEAEDTFALIATRRYEHIVVIGHSLGSVIAFTALDRLGQRVPELLPRIDAFITFGSALEKVRYFFERRKEADSHAAERLVEPAQRISKGKIWLNLWYANDVVANPITTFDSDHARHKNYRHKQLPDELATLLQEARKHLVVNIDYGYPISRLPIVWTHSRYWGDASVVELLTDVALPRASE